MICSEGRGGSSVTVKERERVGVGVCVCGVADVQSSTLGLRTNF